MKVDLFHCCQQSRVDEDLMRIISCSSKDPNRVVTRDKIISEIDGGAEIELDIEDFVIKDLVGSGTFSEVFLLERKKDGRKFAGKFFKVEVCTWEFIRETKIMNSCSHASSTVVGMVGILTTPKCLVMDYYVNGSLNVALLEDCKNVKRGMKTEYPFFRRLGYILDMCKAVTELHQRNICHRDISLRNLLLSDDKEHVLLSDFSLSRVVTSPYNMYSTLTAIVPEASAPETFGRHGSLSTAQNKYGRVYSLKSDIWSMGITMYEIIDKRFCKGQSWKHLPTGFPEKRKPPSNVFDRIDDLWILILRCWNERPEERPQSWDLEDRIQTLIDNPLNVGSEHEGYITRFSPTNVVSSYEHPVLTISESFSPILTGSKLLEQEQILGSSLKLESPYSTTLTQHESSEGLKKITKGLRIKMLSPVKETWAKKKHKQCTTKWTNNEQSFLEHLAVFKPRTSFNGNTSSPNSVPNRSYLKVLQLNKNKSDPFNPNTHLTVNREWKFLKRLGSLSSLYSNTASAEEVPCTPERVEYCSPLTFSYESSATNIAHCGGRRFFKNSPGELIAHEKVDSSKYLLTPPELDTEEENSSSTEVYEIQVMRKRGISVSR